MATVSIIIPVHNSEGYLEKCVQSCLCQTLRDIEIILVDDASTDGSPKIISQFVEKYPEIVRGVLLTRNYI